MRRQRHLLRERETMNENNMQPCPCDAVKRLQDDIETVKRDVSKLYTNEGVTGNRLDTIDASLNRVEGKLDQIMEKPTKRWESVISEILKLIIAGIVGFVLIKIGLQ